MPFSLRFHVSLTEIFLKFSRGFTQINAEKNRDFPSHYALEWEFLGVTLLKPPKN